MHADHYTAVIDACVLAGALTRNMTLSLAEAGLFRPRWSREGMSETERAIQAIHEAKGVPDAGAVARRHCNAIARAFPEAMVDDYELLIPALRLPDANDRHVLAAAIRTGAAVIVTDNIGHFPKDYVLSLGMEVSTADGFLADMIDLDTPGAVAALRTMRARFNRPELDAEALLRRMESAGLTETVNLLIGEIASL